MAKTPFGKPHRTTRDPGPQFPEHSHCYGKRGASTTFDENHLHEVRGDKVMPARDGHVHQLTDLPCEKRGAYDRKQRKPLGTATMASASFAYRHHLVKPGINGLWYISRDGHHIGSAKTPEAAKATIDMLTGDGASERRRQRSGLPAAVKQKVVKAVKAMQVYLGTVDRVDIRQQQKLYDKLMAQVQSIATALYADTEFVWAELEKEARSRGVIAGMPGRHF